MSRVLHSLWSSLLDSAGDASPVRVDDLDASALRPSAPSPSAPAFLAALPLELWLLVLQELSAQDVAHIAQTSADFALLYALLCQ